MTSSNFFEPDDFKQESSNFFEADDFKKETSTFFEADDFKEKAPVVQQPSALEKLAKDLRFAESQRVGGTLKFPEGLGEAFRKAEEQRVGGDKAEDIGRLAEEGKKKFNELSKEYTPKLEQVLEDYSKFLETQQKEDTKSDLSFGKHFLENVTFGATHRMGLTSEVPDEDATAAFVGDATAEAVYWAGIGKIAGPFIAGVKATYGIAASIVAGWQVTQQAGTAKLTLRDLIEKGEMPTGEEVAENVNELVVIHSLFQTLGLGIEFNTAMRVNAKAAGHSVGQEYINLAEAIRNKVGIGKFGKMSQRGQMEVVKEQLQKPYPELEAPILDITPEGKKPIAKPAKPISKSAELKTRKEIREIARTTNDLDKFLDKTIPKSSEIIDKKYKYHNEFSDMLKDIQKKKENGTPLTEEERGELKEYDRYLLNEVYDGKKDAVIISDPDMKLLAAEIAISEDGFILSKREDSYILGKSNKAILDVINKNPVLEIENSLNPAYYNKLYFDENEKASKIIQTPKSEPTTQEKPTVELPKEPEKMTAQEKKLHRKIDKIKKSIAKSEELIKDHKAKGRKKADIDIIKYAIEQEEKAIAQLQKELVIEEKRAAKQAVAKQQQKLEQERRDLAKKKPAEPPKKPAKVEADKTKQQLAKEKQNEVEDPVKKEKAKELLNQIKDTSKQIDEIIRKGKRDKLPQEQISQDVKALNKSIDSLKKELEELKGIVKKEKRTDKQATAKEKQAAKQKAKKPPPPPKKPPAPPAAEPPEKPKKKPAKPHQPVDITTQKVSSDILPTKSTVDQTATRAAKEPTEIYRTPILATDTGKTSLIRKAINKLPKLSRQRSDLAKKAWEKRKDYFGKKWGLEMRYKQRWNKYLTDKKLSASDLEDMIFYLEDPQAVGKSRDAKRTGNPFVDIDDTWNNVNERLSPKAKEAIVEVKKHFAEVLKMLNDSPFVKNINPRQFLEQIYVPHFYQGSPKKIHEILKNKSFSTRNPLANFREYVLLNEALQKAGLVPKYRNISDLLNHYDALVIRVLINSELAAELSDLQGSINQKLIVLPDNKKLYKQAQQEDWIEMSDAYLRSKYIGRTKSGKPIFKTFEANALVHPDLARALSGIFVKEAYKPEHVALSAIDYYNDQVRGIRVQFYPMFHMGALAESLAGAQGFKATKIITEWNEIFSDPEFNEFAAASGLKFGIPADSEVGKPKVLLENVLNKLEVMGGKRGLVAKKTRKGLQKAMLGSEFLFGQLHPRMKMATFADYLAQAERELLKSGGIITPEWRKKTGREIATIVNDQFGGQAWELIEGMHDPKFLKWARRGISYVDWSVSAIRQFTAMFEDIPQILTKGWSEGSTIRGNQSRKYNARYLAALTIFSQIMSYLNTGMGNEKDKEGKPIPNRVIWDYKKAHSTFENKDPKHAGYLSQFFHYQLPDVQYEAGGVKWNPGRDEKGRRRYSHGGKQFLELAKYITNFTGQMFAKSSPFIQFVIPWFMEKQPGEGDWKTRGVWEGGKTIPWDGSEPYSIERAESYLNFIGGQFIPFFGRAIWKDPGAFSSVFYGTFPVSKGISLTGSDEYFRTYYRVLENDGYSEAAKKTAYKRINELEEVLYEQNYSQAQINKRKNSAIKWNKERSNR